MTYEEAVEWLKRDPSFIDEIIEALVDHDIEDEPHGFTRTEVRDIMVAYYDKNYDPDVRQKMVPDPEPVQIEVALQQLLHDEEDPCGYERDGLFYFHRNEVEEQAIKNALSDVLKGTPGDGPP